MHVRRSLFVLFAAALACFSFSAHPAHAAMVNCAQEEQEDGDEGNLIHFAGSETCFINKEARFFGFSILVRNEGDRSCQASLSAGVFDGSRWVWSDPQTYAFKRYQTREVYYDLAQETNMPVGKIVLLNTGKNMNIQCDGQLSVRFTENNPLTAAESYYGTQDKDAYFKIISEDVARKPRGIPTAFGRSFVRFPEEGLYRGGHIIAFEVYTDVTRSRHPLDYGKKDDPSDDEHFYSQYHLEAWNEAARVWETVVISRPKDVSAAVVQCSDDTVDCYGDTGEIRRVLLDGHYRLRARHFWGRRGWQSWSAWRRFSVNYSTPLLAEPELDPTRRTLFELWLRNGLLGPESVWRRTLFGPL